MNINRCLYINCVAISKSCIDRIGSNHDTCNSTIVCFFMVAVVKEKFKYDDALDAFGVHGIGGILGSILTGVFATHYVTGSLDIYEHGESAYSN